MHEALTTMSREGIFALRSRRRALRQLGAGMLAIAGLAGSGARIARSQGTPVADASEEVARQAIDAVNEALATGDMSAIDAVLAADVQGHPPHRSLVTGEPFSHDLAGLKASLAEMRRFFPDATIAIDDLITSGETVAARVTFQGTPDTTALGLSEAANRQLEIGGIMYGRFANGRIAEFRAYFDLSAYYALIGLLPTATATPGHGHEHRAVAPMASPTGNAEEIAVTLTEFSVTVAVLEYQADRAYTFLITNQGTVPHELTIERAGATHEPLIDDGRMAMTEPIAPGERGSLTWIFAEPGAYQLACHQPGHFEAGQVISIEVDE